MNIETDNGRVITDMGFTDTESTGKVKIKDVDVPVKNCRLKG